MPSSDVAPYPVRLVVERSVRFVRLQLFLRVVVFCTLGMVGLSYVGMFMCVYLALPVYVAVRASTAEGAAAYRAEDRSRILSLLRWFAAVSAWIGLATDRLPLRSPEEAVELLVEGVPSPPTTHSALTRVLTGLPSALALMILGFFGVFVWTWAALTILVGERVGPVASDYLLGLQRWSVRLLAYQAGLTDVYPPFSFTDMRAIVGVRA